MHPSTCLSVPLTRSFIPPSLPSFSLPRPRPLAVAPTRVRARRASLSLSLLSRVYYWFIISRRSCALLSRCARAFHMISKRIGARCLLSWAQRGKEDRDSRDIERRYSMLASRSHSRRSMITNNRVCNASPLPHESSIASRLIALSFYER